MRITKKSTQIFIFLITLNVIAKSRQDCFCGSRDVTPDTYCFKAGNKDLGNLKNLNSKLTENYQIASIVNYIDVFLSKFNRLNLKKPSWPIPLKISGVKNLNFMKKKEGFNTMMTHRISQNLYLEIRIELYNTFKTKGQFNVFTTLVRTNFHPVDKQQLKKGSTFSISKQGILNYPLKRASLSHFYGNQLAVDVCRLMYASVNKIMVDFFDINLQSVVYKEIGTNLMSHKYKKECVEVPSFKVYLGVNQISQMITDTREKMQSFGLDNSEQLKQKLKEINEKGGALNQVQVPKLHRRQSHLLTPIIMEQNGAEMLASDYEGTEQYQQKIREVYDLSYEEFLDQEISGQDKNQSTILIDEQKLFEEKSEDLKVMGQEFSPKKNVSQIVETKSPIEVVNQRQMIVKDLDEESPQCRRECLQKIVGQSRLEREKNINQLEQVINEAIIDNFDRLPKNTETRSEGYLNELRRGFTIQMKNNQALRDKLGIDLDEDDVQLNSHQRSQIAEYLNNQFVFLRTTPLETSINKNFRNLFGPQDPSAQEFRGVARRGKSKIFGRSKSLPKDLGNLQSKQQVNLIGRNEVTVVSQEDKFNEETLLQDGLSQNNEVEFKIDQMNLLPVETSFEAVDVMYSKNDFEEHEFNNPEGSFIANASLSPEEREQMITRVVQIANFIFLNKIKCDFEVYTDRTVYLNMPDLELSDLLANLNMIVEAGTEEQIPVLVTTDPVSTIDLEVEQTQTSVSGDQVEKEKEYFAEIKLEIKGYSKEQVQQMIVMMMQDEAFLTVGQTVINGDKQDQLNRLHLVEYDITEHLANDLSEL